MVSTANRTETELKVMIVETAGSARTVHKFDLSDLRFHQNQVEARCVLLNPSTKKGLLRYSGD